MVNLDELNRKCRIIIPNVRKKSEFENVITFWRDNKDDFNSSMREWRKDGDSGIFLFVKEFSSLLLFFLITGNEYPGDIKSDLEDLYGGFLKNMSFGGRYIINSYLKLYSFNNTDQLIKYGEYIAEDIKHAEEFGVINQTISALCKDYLNKCIIYGVINTAITHNFRKYLTDKDKEYFTNLSATPISKFSHSTNRQRTRKEEIDIFNKIVSGEDDVEIGDNEEIEDNVEIDDGEKIEEIEEIEEIEDSEDSEDIEDSEDSEDIGDNEEIEDNVEIKIVVVSSETQMITIRRAFSQEWLNTQEKEKGRPHLDLMKDIWMIDGFKDAPKISIKKIAKYDMIIIGQNDHLFKDMPKEYTAGQKKDGGIKKCLYEVYGLGEGHVYFPEKNKVPDLSVTRLRACMNEFMSKRTQDIPVL